MTIEDINLQDIYEEILKNRSEIKNIIEASETRLLLKLEEANHKINNLEKENEQLKNKIEYLERENRRNNVAIFGLHQNKESSLDETGICNQLNSILGTNLKETDIANLYLPRNNTRGPIRIKLTNNYTKKYIFKNCYKLKGSKYSIANDLTLTQQRDQRILKKHLNLARIDGNKNCKIIGNRLIVNSTSYEIEDLLKNEETEERNLRTSRSSAPVTPNTTKERTTPTESREQENTEPVDTPRKTSTTKKENFTNITQKQIVSTRTRSGSSSKK